MAKNPDKNYSKLGRKKNCIYFFLRSSQAGVFYFLSNCSNLSSWTWSCAPGFLFQLFLLLVLLRKKKSAKGGKKSSAPAKGKKGKKNASEEEGEVASDDDDKEFDDGLDEDLIGERLFIRFCANRTCCWTAFSEIKLRWSLSEISNIWGYFLVLSHCGPMLSQLSCHSSQLIGITLDRGQMAERTKTYLC